MVNVLTVLHDISSVLMTTIDLDKILTILVRALTLKNAMDYDRAMIFLVDKTTGTCSWKPDMPASRTTPPDLPLRQALITDAQYAPWTKNCRAIKPIQVTTAADQGDPGPNGLISQNLFIFSG